ncbi:glycerate dehydrogenase [Idiomarina fontislapidosi]|uniref:Glycerate dehydrogenase n=1 Tax=Idiomarina fontislapidosi TaxID=263723 RepID=A0A432Y8U0_9GAMM|nr:D-2-hydroxyacid dehydrogenase [Idiomarina fontislapidosi]PYE34640.1 glycerate dehydrogenase [Idiomarina fontislapidosi]RUO57408.1 glycerate dehydrogenase [Idiomarina fontislapidosi]
MKGVVLDAASLGQDVDWQPIAEQLSDWQVFNETSPEQCAERIKDVDIVFSNKVVLDSKALQSATRLKWIGILATGTNNVDHVAAQSHNIKVANVEAYGTASVAQHTLSLMLNLATQAVRYQQRVASGAWQTAARFCLDDFPVVQLAGKHLVIVGHGELGQAVESLAKAFGMRVTIAARPGKADDPRPSLNALLPSADVISFHCPLTEDTRDLLSVDNLKYCKPSALIVNAARGGIVNESDAVAALRRGDIGGLAVDVLSEEPPRNGNPILDAIDEPLNLVVTPHSAWLAPEARQAIIDISATNLRTFIHDVGQ